MQVPPFPLLKHARDAVVAFDELAFPTTCVGRGRLLRNVGFPVCAGCEHAHAPLPEHDIFVRTGPVVVCALFAYQGPFAAGVRRLKYRGERGLAHTFGRYLAEAPVFARDIDVMVPVPLDPVRQWQRGFNQARDLALAVCASRPEPLPVVDALRRRRGRPPQSTLGLAQRVVGLEAHLELRARAIECIAGKRVLLVDDVTTTGATMAACAAIVAKARPKEVFGLALLRTCA